MSNTIDLKSLLDLVEASIPEYNSPEIDDFIAKGNKIEESTLYMSMSGLPKFLRTKHGILKVVNNPYLGENQAYLVKNGIDFGYTP